MRPVAFSRKLRHQRKELHSLEKVCPLPALNPRLKFLVDSLLEIEDEVAKQLYAGNRTPGR